MIVVTYLDDAQVIDHDPAAADSEVVIAHDALDVWVNTVVKKTFPEVETSDWHLDFIHSERTDDALVIWCRFSATGGEPVYFMVY